MVLNPEFRSIRRVRHYPWRVVLVGAFALLGLIALSGWLMQPFVAPGRSASVAADVVRSPAPPDRPAPRVAAQHVTSADAADVSATDIPLDQFQARVDAALAVQPLLFDSRGATLSVAQQAWVAQLADGLRDGRFLIRVRGHADSAGGPERRLLISRQRAEAVRAAFIGAGIAADRLLVEGWGARLPVASNMSEDGRARNRRVDLVLREGRR